MQVACVTVGLQDIQFSQPFSAGWCRREYWFRSRQYWIDPVLRFCWQNFSDFPPWYRKTVLIEIRFVNWKIQSGKLTSKVPACLKLQIKWQNLSGKMTPTWDILVISSWIMLCSSSPKSTESQGLSRQSCFKGQRQRHENCESHYQTNGIQGRTF